VVTRPIHHLIARFAIRALGDRLDATTRDRFEGAMTLARERLDAADLLERAPERAESIHVLARAVQALEEAIRFVDPVIRLGGGPTALAPEETVSALESARERLDRAPHLDADLSREDLSHRRETRRLAGRVYARVRKMMRRRRIVIARRFGLLAIMIGFIAVGRVGLTLHDRVEVLSSGIYGPAFDADQAVDGNAVTEWLAPDNQSAWLELRFAPPIEVIAVRVTNAHNPPFNDRAVKDLDVELYRKNQLLLRTQSTFTQIDPTPSARNIPIEAKGVTRLRLVARSFHGRGAGLAEIEVIEAPSPSAKTVKP
jgi:hypothetical protein